MFIAAKRRRLFHSLPRGNQTKPKPKQSKEKRESIIKTVQECTVQECVPTLAANTTVNGWAPHVNRPQSRGCLFA